MNKPVYFSGKDGLYKKYGNTPETRKGVQGEDLWEKYAKKIYDWVIRHDEQDKQYAGFDFEFYKKGWRRSYTADIKTNMNTNGDFYVDVSNRGWLMSDRKLSDRIIHICPITNIICEYDRKILKTFLKQNPEKIVKPFKGFLLKLNIKNTWMYNDKPIFRTYSIQRTFTKTGINTPRNINEDRLAELEFSWY